MAGNAGGFSKNVLNMKFMKQAEKRAEEKEEEQLESKLKDLSEWKTSDSESLKKKAQAKPKVISVGFTAINNLNNGPPVIGRRTFGETKKEEAKPTEEANELDKLWQKQKEERSEPKREKRSKDDSPKKTHNKKRKSTN